jgi:hypothetical protein
VTDELQQLLDAYAARASASSSVKLDVLMDIERIRDQRVLQFLLSVVRDHHESDEVRIYVLKQLRLGNGLHSPDDRVVAANAIGEVLASRSSADVRVQAALALGALAQVNGVLDQLAAICSAQDESIDLRYAAFTSLERGGPTPECIAHLREIASDDTLGGSARSVLSAWHVA